jgi:sugar transferase (PEP-CTERM/EpsH1 system associated)
MANVLYLVHRMPYPPDKGDKVRSYHLLKHLTARHHVFLGTFLDDPADEAHVKTLRDLCTDLYVARLNPRAARLRSLGNLIGNNALTLRYYHDAGLRRWVDDTAARNELDAVVVFSSAMAQYVEELNALPLLADLVDVDSAKWAAYADTHRWPMSWLYRREARCLLAHERRVAGRARKTFFVTEKEAALFRDLAPECASSVEAMGNGVDAERFCPDATLSSPFPSGTLPIVFTGAMDYWPNVDAVTWFARDMLPALRRCWPHAHFWIVGRSPASAVQALATDGVTVTGTVDDVRPYLQHACVVVAPLRLARGIQNKVLEAMAMARPVVVSAECAAPIDAVPDIELLTADDADGFVQQVSALLAAPECALAIGGAARRCVVQRYAWEAHLAGLDRHLTGRGLEPPIASLQIAEAAS